MRKIDLTVVVLVLCGAMTFSGCAGLKDKFVRKNKKEETRVQRYYAVKEYDVQPNIELYTKRYLYWKSWHRDLEKLLTSIELNQDVNMKKVKVAVEQEVSNLMDMQSMLVPEKAKELQKYLDDMEKVEMTIKKEGITRGNQARTMRVVETSGRQIKKYFSYTKIGDYIASEFREEKQDPDQ